MNIKTKDIQFITNTLLDEIKEDLDFNFTTFWNIPFEEGQSLYKPEQKVSDLREDWKQIEHILVNEKYRLDWTDFEHLGNIIKALGLKMKNLKEVK